MNKKLPITFISMLMLLSLVCVGFAAWCIDDSLAMSDSVTGSFDVDNIISGGDTNYLTTDAVVFEYYDDGFLKRDGTKVTLSRTGYITINVTVNKANLPSLTNPTFNISLTQDDETAPNLLANTYVKNIYVNQTSGEKFTITPSYSPYKVSGTYIIGENNTSIGEKYTFIIEFIVPEGDTTPEGDTIFFKTLFDKKISFGYSVTIEGGDENA